jgi:hypothetical protein
VRALPEVVIPCVGDWTIDSSPDSATRTANVFEAVGIPVILLRSPADFRGQGLDTRRAEIERCKRRCPGPGRTLRRVEPLHEGREARLRLQRPGLQRFSVAAPQAIPAGKATIRFEFAYDGGGLAKGGLGTIYVNDKKVAEGRIERTLRGLFTRRGH